MSLYVFFWAAYERSSVDDFWFAWSTGAEESLFRAYCRAGGPVAGNPQMYLGRGELRVRIRRLGGRSAGGSCSSRPCRVSRGDEVDTHAAPLRYQAAWLLSGWGGCFAPLLGCCLSSGAHRARRLFWGSKSFCWSGGRYST